MNVYLIPFSTESGCDILKITACSLESCKVKIIEHYADKFDDLADIEDYDEFLDTIYDRYEIYIGEIHEIEEYES